MKDNDVLESFTTKDRDNKRNVSLLRWSKLVKEIKNNNGARVGAPTQIKWDGPVHVGSWKGSDDAGQLLTGSMVAVG